MNAKPLSQLVDPSWLPALEPVEPIIHEIGERLRAEVSAGAAICRRELMCCGLLASLYRQ